MRLKVLLTEWFGMVGRGGGMKLPVVVSSRVLCPVKMSISHSLSLTLWLIIPLLFRLELYGPIVVILVSTTFAWCIPIRMIFSLVEV